MGKILKEETPIFFLMIILLAGIQTIAYFLSAQGMQGWLFISFLLILVFISLFGGPVIGLFSSLVYMFLIGSFLFYLLLPGSSMNFQVISISMPLLLIYGFSLILLVLVAGRIHLLIANEVAQKRELEEEVRQFVAVDVETGFVNKHRMAIEVESEMSRINRYGGLFTLILFQIDFYDDFKRLYGEKERIHLLQSIATKINESTRTTDLKYRYDADRFALLLTNTSDESVEIVYEKLAEQLKSHKLLSGKIVTISFRAGHIAYDQNTGLTEYESLFAQVEREMISREL